MKKLDEEAEKIKTIYNNGWVKNWGFVPWTDLEMKHMVKSLSRMADPEIIILAEEKSGTPVGFSFGIPNYNEVLIKVNGRLLPFGIFRILRNRKRIKSCASRSSASFRSTGIQASPSRGWARRFPVS